MPRRRDIDRLQGEIEELFADLWTVPSYSGIRAGLRPQVDCFRTDDPPALTVVVELAGIDPDTLRIVIGERRLSVAGERPRPGGGSRRYEQMEIEYGPFERRVQLTEAVAAGEATAAYENGMLTISLPLAPPEPEPEPVPAGHVTIVVRSRR
jgi:HSP20 family molecular chaperone IbpA